MRIFFTIAQVFLLATVLQAQSLVQGVVKDISTMDAISGATVTVKGTNIGTQTDVTGSFSIQASPTDSIIISFLGYHTQAISVGNRTQINVFLESETEALDEVVVIGYGTQSQRNLTTAVTTVRADDIAKTPNAQPMQALQGRVAGVQIVSSGAPGASPTVRLRGVGSFEGNSAPLYVVDGMFFDNIDFLNPNDIETISVLKDASAAAIYGVRAGNGVVLIETKTGAYNKPGELVYDGYYGIQNPQNVLKMANAQQFVQYINETGSAADIAFIENAMQRYGRSRVDPNIPNVNTDWYKEIMSPAPIQNHNLSFNGGGERIRYSLGGAYFNQEGLLNEARNSFKRFNFRTKVDAKVKDWLTVGGNFNVSAARQYIGDDAAWFRAYFAVPIFPAYDDLNTTAEPYKLGNAQLLGYRGSQNPLYPLLYVDNRNHVGKVLGNFYGEVDLVPNKLSFRTAYNYSLANVNVRRVDFAYNDGATDSESAIRREHRSRFDQVWDNYFTYDDRFDKHSLNVVLGHSYRSEYSELLAARGTAINPMPAWEQEQFWYLSNATDYDLNSINDNAGINSRLFYLSFFGRASYNYDGRYLLYGTLRRDGNNKFQERWGNFATVGAGWIASAESFFNVPGVDFLKFRASWGQLGNDGIRPSVGKPVVEENNLAIDDVRYIGRRLNPTFDLIEAWETTVETNFGIDAKFLNNRLSFTGDYFVRDTRNLAVGVVPPVFRASERRSVGEIRNKGVELALDWSDNITEDFSYNIGGNIATLKNTVLGLGGPDGLDAGSAEFRQRSIIGHPYQAFFGYQVAGVFQRGQASQDADLPGMAQASGYTEAFIRDQNLQAGDLIYKDINGDGVINDQDRVVLGSYLPSFTWGGNLGFQYKKFEFSALFQGQADYSILNRKRGEIIFTNDTNIDADLATNMWRGEGTSNKYPSASGLRRGWNQRLSEYFIEDGSYFRVQNVRLSYTFFGQDYRSGQLPETRLTFTAERPLTVFKYNGFNPEVADGIDRQVYPIPAIYTVGVTIKL